jgi:hypothetical protein
VGKETTFHDGIPKEQRYVIDIQKAEMLLSEIHVLPSWNPLAFARTISWVTIKS